MYRNQLEIRFCGLQRSGNHAIIDWIICQFSGERVCFLNNIFHGERDPFLSASQIFVYGIEGIPNGRFRDDPESLRLEKKDVLIYSYEDSSGRLLSTDSFLKSVYSQGFDDKREEYLGTSKRFIDVFLLRDPYNFFASRLKKLEDLTGVKDLDIVISFWKEIAKKAIYLSETQEKSKIFVSYNKWFSSKN